jgi:hypothetical protein
LESENIKQIWIFIVSIGYRLNGFTNLLKTMKSIFFKIILFLFLFYSISNGYAQIPVGEFREHLPFKSFFHVAVTPDYVYASTLKNLMVLDKKNGYTKSTLSKLDGLSEIGIENLTYLKNNQLLMIIYNSSNLDFLKKDSLVNMPEIKEKQILGSKKINGIYEKGDIVYLATGFGIVSIDVKRFLVIDTWFTNLNGLTYQVFGFTEFQNRYYITTDKGVFSIPTDDIRIPDFSAWNFESQLDTSKYTYIETIGNHLVVNKPGEVRDSIFTYINGTWQFADAIYGFQVMNFRKQNNELAILDYDQVRIYDENLNLTHIYKWLDGSYLALGRDIAFDGLDVLWIADQYHGLAYFNRPETYPVIYTLEGPASEMVENMDCQDGVLAIAPGSMTSWGINYIPPSISIFKNQTWSYLNSPFYYFEQPHDIVNVAVNPYNTNEIYAASWSGGLFRIVNDTIKKQWNSYNSPLQSIHASSADTTQYVFVSGLCFDAYRNLWLTNSKVTKPLKVLKSDSTWQSFSLAPYITGNEENVAQFVYIDSRNYKWITFPRQNKLIVYNDNKTIDDLSDDEIAQIDLNSSANIQTVQINCITEDLNGNMWIGCDRTVKVVYNPSSVFDKQLYAKNILLEQNGYVHNLFEFETVTSIAVDGANRKWIGTSKAGVYLMSENGTEQILQFEEENSPLISNQINSITIDQKSGEVYFATTAGLISYRGTATEGEKNYNNYKVFPNPVKSGYTGYITVTGLMENSFCKIVDASGLLVWQGYADGGQLVWNGLSFNGLRPATGVYFVFASSDTGSEKQVAKILFIN